jgi:hypothetical protein
MINEQTFSPDSIAGLRVGARSARGMTVAGTVLKSLVLFVLTCASAVVGWNYAARVIEATSDPHGLGYFLLIALSFRHRQSAVRASL